MSAIVFRAREAASPLQAQDAALAIVTPGHAPLGMTMSLTRRLALLAWARRSDAWIIEDDYPSELQLTDRAVPALASLDHGGRVPAYWQLEQDDQPSSAPRVRRCPYRTDWPATLPTPTASDASTVCESDLYWFWAKKAVSEIVKACRFSSAL